MFEYLTRPVQRAMVLADAETRELGHNYTTAERLLPGLLREQEGVAAVRMLEALNVAPDSAREEVMRVVGSDEVGTGDGRSLAPRRALRSASDEALRLGHEHGDAGRHVLLGFVGEFERVAARVLYRLGLDPDVTHREVAGASGSGRRLPEASDAWQVCRAPRRSGHVWSGSWSRRAAAFRTRSAPPRPLRKDLRYSYEAGEEIISTRLWAMGGHREHGRASGAGAVPAVGDGDADDGGEARAEKVPTVQEATVAIMKLQASTEREVSGGSVEVTFGR